jgi:hypothetical protein
MSETPPSDREVEGQGPSAPGGLDAALSDATLSNVVALHPPPPEPEAAPPAVAELAEACVRFVRAAVGVSLDFRPETLPVLDHYLATRRDELLAARTANPEVMGLVARSAAAYFGEVVRAHFRSFWHLPSDEPAAWELRFESVYLSVNPVAVVYDAISHGDEEGPIAYLELEDEDREAVAAHLCDLPPAPDEEFFSLAMRLEVLEIAVDVIKARMMAVGLGEVELSSEDYDN